jgi:hypothetical protein
MKEVIRLFQAWLQKQKRRRIETKLNKELSRREDDLRPATQPSHRYFKTDSSGKDTP